MSFVTTVYRKPNFSGMYTHLDSFLPTVFKFGMIYTIAYQYFKICSDWKKIHKELHFLKRAFSKNVYPLLFIDKDRLPFNLVSEKVHKYVYKRYNSSYYVQRERHLKVRSGEHTEISSLTFRKLNHQNRVQFFTTPNLQ